MFVTPSIDVEQFHTTDLPARLEAGNHALVGALSDGLRPLTLAIDGQRWTYSATPDGLEVRPGADEGAWEVTMASDRFAAYAREYLTAFGILYGNFADGAVRGLTRWEPAIRAAYHGRPGYDPAAVVLDGVDPTARFTVRDGADAIRIQLDRVGFVVVSGVFDRDEVETMRREVDRLASDARPGDNRSWWARNAWDEDVVCRLTYVHDRSPVFAALHRDHRIVDLIDGLGADVCAQPDRHDGHSVVIKQPSVRSGLSDLPWHVDCGLGGHPVMCPGFNVGVQLDAATADTGQLHCLVGSHHTTAWHLTAEQLADDDHPTVALDTEPGDVTIHSTDLLHAAPAPTGRGGRRAFYVSFKNPAGLDVIPVGRGYNDVVLSSGEGNRVRNLAET